MKIQCKINFLFYHQGNRTKSVCRFRMRYFVLRNAVSVLGAQWPWRSRHNFEASCVSENVALPCVRAAAFCVKFRTVSDFCALRLLIDQVRTNRVMPTCLICFTVSMLLAAAAQTWELRDALVLSTHSMHTRNWFFCCSTYK